MSRLVVRDSQFPMEPIHGVSPGTRIRNEGNGDGTPEDRPLKDSSCLLPSVRSAVSSVCQGHLARAGPKTRARRPWHTEQAANSVCATVILTV
jgi:hypothetical protein